ncbi:MAG: hypothetical protein Q4D98_03905 [Planctomycetia bacterium]|nr:hypothetical protein [Planctomycetia bacterium]
MKRFWNRILLLSVSLFPLPVAVWAQDAAAKAPEEAKSASWAIPYIIVVLATTGVLWVVCQPSKRREKAKKDDF